MLLGGGLLGGFLGFGYACQLITPKHIFVGVWGAVPGFCDRCRLQKFNKIQAWFLVDVVEILRASTGGHKGTINPLCSEFRIR